MHVKMGKGDKGIKNGHEPGEGNMAGKTGNRKRIIRKSSDEMVLLSLLRIIAYPDVLLKFRKTFRYVHFSGRLRN